MPSFAMTCRRGSCARRSRVCGGKVMALRHWLQLALTDGIGPILANRLIEATGSIENAVAALPKAIGRVEGIGTKKSDTIHRSLSESAALVDDELRRATEQNV